MFLGDASQQTILGVVFIEPQTKATVLVDIATKTFYQIVNPTAETPVGTTYSFLTTVTGTVTPAKDANSIAQITVIPNGYSKYQLDTAGFLMQNSEGVFISTKDGAIYRISNPTINFPVWSWVSIKGTIFFKGIDFANSYLEVSEVNKLAVPISGLIIPGVSPTNTFTGDAGSSFLKGDNGLNYQIINPSINTPVGNRGLVTGYVYLKGNSTDSTKELLLEALNYSDFQPITAIARTGVIMEPATNTVTNPTNTAYPTTAITLPQVNSQAIIQPSNDLFSLTQDPFESSVVIPGQSTLPVSTQDNVIVNVPKTSFKFTPATAALGLLALLFMVRK